MKLTRRRLLHSSSLIAGGAALLPATLGYRRSRAEKVKVAAVGVWNRGRANLEGVMGEEVVAICDVDSTHLANAARLIEDRTGAPCRAGQYRDYRRMLDEVSGLDAVVVSTADHSHAAVAAAALRRGLHVYCEKPLAHSPGEVRVLQRLAREQKLVTQMGTQIHAGDNYRRVVELVRSGAIGQVSEAHVWVGKSWANGRFGATKDAPARLDWDLWQGPVAARPYCDGLHPAHWRRFWEYGTGTLGDMACHYMDLVHWALDLGQPRRVLAEGPALHPDGTPGWMQVHFVHQVGEREVVVHWADAAASSDYSEPGFGNGVRFVGSEGTLLCDYGRRVLQPEEKFDGFEAPAPSIPPSVGHHQEWLAGIKEDTPTTCNFEYSGDLALTVVLGNVAFRAGRESDGSPCFARRSSYGPREWRGELDWDAAAGKTGQPRADSLLLREYRAGWEL